MKTLHRLGNKCHTICEQKTALWAKNSGKQTNFGLICRKRCITASCQHPYHKTRVATGRRVCDVIFWPHLPGLSCQWHHLLPAHLSSLPCSLFSSVSTCSLPECLLLTCLFWSWLCFGPGLCVFGFSPSPTLCTLVRPLEFLYPCFSSPSKDSLTFPSASWVMRSSPVFFFWAAWQVGFS